jgi:hypothetical protein
MKSSLNRHSNKMEVPFLDTPRLNLEWFSEPVLSFADGRMHSNPKVGIPLFGPKSMGTARHTNEIHIGVVGEGKAIENVRRFITACSKGVMAEDIANGSLPYPGITRELGYRFEVLFSEQTTEKITSQERDRIFGLPNSENQFVSMLDLIEIV